MNEEKKVTGLHELNDEELSNVSGGAPMFGESSKGFTLNSRSRATMNGTANSTADLRANGNLRVNILNK